MNIAFLVIGIFIILLLLDVSSSLTKIHRAVREVRDRIK